MPDCPPSDHPVHPSRPRLTPPTSIPLSILTSPQAPSPPCPRHCSSHLSATKTPARHSSYHPYGVKSSSSSLLTRTSSSPAQPVDSEAYRHHCPAHSLSNLLQSNSSGDAVQEGLVDTPTQTGARRGVATSNVSENSANDIPLQGGFKQTQASAPMSKGGKAVRVLAQQIEGRLSESLTKPPSEFSPQRSDSTCTYRAEPQVAVDPAAVVQGGSLLDTPLRTPPDDLLSTPQTPAAHQKGEVVVFDLEEEEGLPTIRPHRPSPGDLFLPRAKLDVRSCDFATAAPGTHHYSPGMGNEADLTRPDERTYKRGSTEYSTLLARLAQLEDRLTELEHERSAAVPPVCSSIPSGVSEWLTQVEQDTASKQGEGAGLEGGEKDWPSSLLDHLGLNVGEPPRRKRDLPGYLFLAGIGIGAAVSRVVFSKRR